MGRDGEPRGGSLPPSSLLLTPPPSCCPARDASGVGGGGSHRPQRPRTQQQLPKPGECCLQVRTLTCTAPALQQWCLYVLGVLGGLGAVPAAVGMIVV